MSDTCQLLKALENRFSVGHDSGSIIFFGFFCRLLRCAVRRRCGTFTGGFGLAGIPLFGQHDVSAVGVVNSLLSVAVDGAGSVREEYAQRNGQHQKQHEKSLPACGRTPDVCQRNVLCRRPEALSDAAYDAYEQRVDPYKEQPQTQYESGGSDEHQRVDGGGGVGDTKFKEFCLSSVVVVQPRERTARKNYVKPDFLPESVLFLFGF